MSFEVTSRHVNLNQHILCEASAGTGKTFTIEHMFIRRLITSPQSRVQEIAVLTFTKAVARELVLRIQRALDKACTDLRTKSPASADYLQAIIEEGKDEEALVALEIARSQIHMASIDTIHGFCYKTLSEYETRVCLQKEVRFASSTEILLIIEEFFRTALADDIFTTEALKILLKKEHNSFAALLERVYGRMWDEKKKPVRTIPELVSCLQAFPKSHLSQEQIAHELFELTHHFKGLRDRSGVLKDNISECIEAFSRIGAATLTDECITELIKNPLFVSDLFAEPKAKSPNSFGPSFALAQKLEPLLRELAHAESLLDRLCVSCRRFCQKELQKRGLTCQEELLEKMEHALENPAFTHFLRKTYSCVIVDEFQDTDPRQWQILKKLFVTNWEGVLYLVGDPKQAIYSFRQADVYSYMQAKSLENHAFVTLTRNFRSSPRLVMALNTLFVGPHTESLFALPKLQTALHVPAVTAAGSIEDMNHDGMGAIHFFVATGTIGRKRSWPTDELETECFYPFIAQEIVREHQQDVHFRNMAILVKDRYQAYKIEFYLASRGIPTLSWRKKSLIDSKAHLFLERLLAAIASPRDRSRLIDLVIQQPFFYSSANVLRLHDDLDFWAEHVQILQGLKKTFDESKVVGLVHAFLQGTWPEHKGAMKQVVWEYEEFLADLEAIVELSVEYSTTIEALQAYLHALKKLPQSEKDQRTSKVDAGFDGVQILTLHASKGLEFEVVFGLGLASRSPEPAAGEDGAEIDAEKVRQFYVACTRAKARLYLPVAVQLDAREMMLGTKAPIELFLQNIQSENPVEWLVNHSQGTITQSTVLNNFETHRLVQEVKRQGGALLLPPQDTGTSGPFLTSFTSLKDERMGLFKGVQQERLPAGAECGLLLHALLAELVKNKSALDFSYLKKRLVATVYEGYEEDVFILLTKALSVNLGSFRLSDLDPRKISCEVEFCYEERTNRFIRGAVDLFFEHEGAFYLLDWKSNVLELYDSESLANEVKAQGYDLQAKIYSQALLRHLSSKKDQFRGFYFVFLRGLQDSKSDGVLFMERGRVVDA